MIGSSSATASRLVGVWRLVSYAVEQAGQQDRFPFGPEPEGFLIYTSDGFVSAQLMKPRRSPFQSHDWNGGTPDEYQQAGSGYIAYCRVYQVDEEHSTVAHTPSVALVPNLIHEGQLRLITFTGDRLILRAVGTREAPGASITSRLEWQRAGAIGD
jgi:hypothetical protein